MLRPSRWGPVVWALIGVGGSRRFSSATMIPLLFWSAKPQCRRTTVGWVMGWLGFTQWRYCRKIISTPPNSLVWSRVARTHRGLLHKGVYSCSWTGENGLIRILCIIVRFNGSQPVPFGRIGQWWVALLSIAFSKPAFSRRRRGSARGCTKVQNGFYCNCPTFGYTRYFAVTISYCA